MRKFFAISLSLLFLACGVVRADSPAVLPADKLLPDDTLVMFTIPDFNRVREVARKSPQGQLWNDPAMRDFKDKCVNQVSSGFFSTLQHDLGIKLADYADLPQGQFTVAFIQNGWTGREGQASMLVLLDTKDKSAQLKTNLDELKKKWVNLGKTVHTEKIRDVDFSAVMVSKNDFMKPPKPGPMGPGLPDAMPVENTNAPTPFYVGQVGSMLIAGDSPKVIEKILARMSGGQVNVLGDLATFDADRPMFHDAPVYGWVNVQGLVDLLSKANQTTDADAAANPFAFQTDKILAAIGLSAVKAMAFNCRVTDDGTEFNLNFSVPDSRRTGVVQILAGEPKDCNPPAFVPADTVKFQRWRFDGQKTWAAIRKTVSDISPTAIGGLDFALKAVESSAQEKDPSFDINKNLFGNIGGDIVTYEKLPKDPADPNSAPSIFLLGSPNPDQLADALRRVASLNPALGGAPKDREFLGHKIYTFTMPSPPGTNGAPSQPRALTYTSAGGYLAISSEPGMVEEYLRSSENPAKPLRDTAGLADAMHKVASDGASMFGFANENESMRASFETLRNNPDAPDALAPFAPIFMMLNIGDVKTKDWMDASLLPPFDKVSKYFYFTVYGVSTTPDSINLKFFAPTPPQLKK